MKMRTARMYGYHQPLRLEEIDVPDPGPEEVLVRVGGAGMCRTDFQLIEGYFDTGLSMDYPITPGHEVAGWVDGIGTSVPKSAGLSEGDQVVVFFDAEGVARDQIPYRNTYAWFLTLYAGQIVRASAFFDSIAFNDLWERVPT